MTWYDYSLEIIGEETAEAESGPRPFLPVPHQYKKLSLGTRGDVALVVRGRRPPRIDNQLANLPEPLAGNRSDTALNPVLEPLADQTNFSSLSQESRNLKMGITG